MYFRGGAFSPADFRSILCCAQGKLLIEETYCMKIGLQQRNPEIRLPKTTNNNNIQQNERKKLKLKFYISRIHFQKLPEKEPLRQSCPIEIGCIGSIFVKLVYLHWRPFCYWNLYPGQKFSQSVKTSASSTKITHTHTRRIVSLDYFILKFTIKWIIFNPNVNFI